LASSNLGKPASVAGFSLPPVLFAINARTTRPQRLKLHDARFCPFQIEQPA
jgi:hypothetical protein